MAHNYQYFAGDLLEVMPMSDFEKRYHRYYMAKVGRPVAPPSLFSPKGPSIPNHITATSADLSYGTSILAISDTTRSAHRNNYKLYLEVMTPRGLRVAWCSNFRMKKKEE